LIVVESYCFSAVIHVVVEAVFFLLARERNDATQPRVEAANCGVDVDQGQAT
jgi:hypothetical protein